MKKHGRIPEIEKNRSRWMQISIARRLCLGMLPCAAILSCAFQAAFAADSISGIVRNRTSGQPAVGDEVILLRLDQTPHEEARTTIDTQGGFTFDVPYPNHPHIVRIVHQGVNYDKHIADAGAISIDVFDTAAKVRDITGNIEIIRAGVRGSALHVSDMIEIWNQSEPPITQAGKRSFEVYLPAGAMIDSVFAAGPDNITVSISAKLILGEPGHYTVDYPLLPGATKFAFNYDLPYKGQATITTKSVYPFKQLAVMFPPTMTFATKSSAFQALVAVNERYHVEATENIDAGAALEFEISGTGVLPALRQQSAAAPNPTAAIPTPAATTPTARASPTENTVPMIVSQQKIGAHSSSGWWFVLAVAVLALTMCVLFIRRRERLRRRAIGGVTQLRYFAMQSPAPLVDSLKDALFQLESDRLQGVISGSDYASVKRALEETIHWALTRAKQSEAYTAVPVIRIPQDTGSRLPTILCE